MIKKVKRKTGTLEIKDEKGEVVFTMKVASFQLKHGVRDVPSDVFRRKEPNGLLRLVATNYHCSVEEMEEYELALERVNNLNN